VPHTDQMSRRAIGWALVVVQFALLAVVLLAPRRPITLLGLAVGVPVVAAGIVLGLLAGRRLGPALTPTPVPVTGAGLRTDGAYRFVRHPIYSAVLLMVLGYVIAVGSWATVAAGVLVLAFLWAKSRWEDGLLREQYGDEWGRWASRTGALVPTRNALGRRD
jgi:protein-S-isoprenylcysteine O-methyltransferase Ste14